LEPAAVAASAFPGWARAIASDVDAGRGLVASLADAPSRSAVDAILSRAAPGAGLGALAWGAPCVVEWWTTDRDRGLAITGDDLLRAGVPAGPRVGAGLAGARAALIDGRVRSRDEQL